MLLDTSGLLCFLYEKEPQHSKATQLLKESRGRLLTHSYVLAELITLASVRGFSRPVAIKFAANIAKNANFEVVWVDKRLHQTAMQLLIEQQDNT